MEAEAKTEEIQKAVELVLGKNYTVEVKEAPQFFSLYIRGRVSVILEASKWDKENDKWQTAVNIASLVKKSFDTIKSLT